MAYATGIAGIMLVGLPVYLVVMVGIALAAWHVGRHPQAAMLALLGFGILLLDALSGAVLPFLTMRLQAAGRTVVQIAPILTGVALARSFVHAAGLLCLVLAIFRDRQPAS